MNAPVDNAREVRERPLLFSAPMVRAVLDGRKAMTRRIVQIGDHARAVFYRIDDKARAVFGDSIPDDPVPSYVPCPYGVTGDRLWVKETFSRDYVRDVYPFAGGCWYREEFCSVDDPSKHDCLCAGPDPSNCIRCRAKHEGKPFRWRPSIFMPRSLSRITLEVTSIRVERLQSITEEDAKAEGVPALGWVPAFRDSFRQLWDELNGKRMPWAANPWIWVVGFRKLEAKHG